MKYKVVYEGDIFPGHERAEVQESLAKLFRIDTNRANSLFTGQLHTFKNNLELKFAKKYSRALAKMGAMALIEQEVVEVVQPAEPQPAVVETAPPAEPQVEVVEIAQPVEPQVEVVEIAQPVEPQVEIVEIAQPVEPQPAAVEYVKELEEVDQNDPTFTETGSFDVRVVQAFLKEQESKKAEEENEETADHGIFGVNEISDVAAAVLDDAELSSAHDVLNASALNRMIKQSEDSSE